MAKEIDGVHLGPNGTVTGFNETSLPLPGQLGGKFWIGQRQFQVVKCHADTAYPSGASGLVCYWQDSDDFVVSDVVQAEGTSGNLTAIAGMYCGTVTPGNYCIIQKKGPAVVAVSGSVVDGVTLHGLDIADGSLGFTAVGTDLKYQQFGRAVGDVNAATTPDTAAAILSVED